eukprot:CAMPEP_0204287086 /NCGR_PEP_ID=MMETSP0468-20130131/53994_1 /ASSEMBLY_ACC=CAM_ASM_000383 /TAXON_ID=2969 /ORGANISM="Oxyrrhis marina" /LENGTH=138 /DNA_ID=CAMNT_0051265039 /DNA_START=323 /DNA_END=740 /DNA_ORIENTATION=-
MVDPALDVIGKPKSARMASILPGRSFEDFELSTPRTSQRRNQASHELGPIVPDTVVAAGTNWRNEPRQRKKDNTPRLTSRTNTSGWTATTSNEGRAATLASKLAVTKPPKPHIGATENRCFELTPKAWDSPWYNLAVK